MTRSFATISTLLAATALAGCTVGPNYHAPPPQTPASFSEPVPAGASADAVDLAQWWKAYQDPELDQLVQTALDQGLSIRMAASRVHQARIAETVARSRFLPSVNASAGGNYVRFSKNAGFSQLASLFGGGGGGSGGGSGGGVALPGDSITTYSAGFDASWEIDLFGGNKRSLQSATANAEAAEWNARDAAVSLAGEVADNYFQLRTLQQREAILRGQIASQQRRVELQRHIAESGLTPPVDTVRENASLSQLQAQLEPLLVQEQIQMHAIALLTGQAPGALIDTLSQPSSAAVTPPAAPPGLPSELLRRRPDVRAAERKLAASTADIGVAVADLYPKFSLTGIAQLISTALGNLFTPDSLQLNAGAKAMFPVLDFGRGKAQVDVKREQREQAYISYQQTVLGALKDVEDALARVDGEQKRNQALRHSVADAQRSLDAVQARYNSGLINLTPVLDARTALLKQQDALADSNGTLDRALAGLYKALGGGWDDATLQHIEAMKRTPLDGDK